MVTLWGRHDVLIPPWRQHDGVMGTPWCFEPTIASAWWRHGDAMVL